MASETKRIDFLLITALHKELYPVIEIFKAKRLQKDPTENYQYYSAELNSGARIRYSIVLACAGGKGQSFTTAALSAAVPKWRPRHVIMTGIAATIPGGSKNINHILIADTIVDLSEFKVLPAKEVTRALVHDCEFELVNSAKELSVGYKKIHVGIIVSQHNLVKSAILRKKLVDLAGKVTGRKNEVIGIEMEGGGLGIAIKTQHSDFRPGFIMIKAVVDFANNRKKDATQKRAARHAASFVQKYLSYGPIGPSTDKQLIPSVAISMNNLPWSGEELFGRQQKLKQLHSAWSDPGTNVISVVASAGVGKSALVNHWLAKIAKNHYHGATRVYAWSFYSQGIRESTVSADEFIDKALRDFRDTDPTAGSPLERGERLAHLIRQEKTLLILDGVEPLQNPPGPNGGMLKDQALVSLIRALAAANPGLCVITTRYPVADIEHYKKTTAPIIELKSLSSIAGSEFLRALGVRGAKHELQRASIEFGGHALALKLLGTYIRDVCAGDVQRRNEVKLLEADAEQGGHASRVMASYEKWFGDGPEIAVLCLLGLFDRRADARAVDAVRQAPAIRGLTDKLERLSETDWRFTLARLRRAKLIAEPNPNGQDDLDTHALVREYFEQQLRKAHPSAWLEGHNRLHEYFKMAAPALPDSPVEMAPLFLAVTHGCRAGLYQDTLDGVVKRRILRIQRWDDPERFASKNLGMANSVLSALSSFCGPNWCQPVNELREEDKARVVFEAGFYLSTQLRPEAAGKALSKALELCEAQHDDTLAGASLGDLSRLNLTLGKIKEAISYAEKAVSLADKSGNLFRRMEVRTYLASALHQGGRHDIAETVFREAENVQSERHRLDPQVQPPLLWSFQGWLYCDLLLDQRKFEEVKARAEQTLSWATQKQRLPDIALDHLSLGRAYLLEVQHDKAGAFSEASSHLDNAVNGLQEARERQHLPRAFLARAEAYRMRDDFKNAKLDLNAAMEIVEYANMDLFKADIQLEYARIYLAMGKKDEARERLAVGQDLISRMGYSRRDKDVEELTQQL